MPSPDAQASPVARAALSVSGLVAEIARDGFSETGWVLRIGGVEQSHVDLADPTALRHEYLRRVANVLDSAAPAGAPLSVLHLGGGALTLARYVQATRPGSAQVVVEIEPELPPFITEHLPLPVGTVLDVRIGDAAAQLDALGDARWDMIVLDVFDGRSSPAHLARERFYAHCLRHLTESGVLVVNIGDEDGLGFFADQAVALRAAADEAGVAGPWTLTDAAVANLLEEGNLIAALGPGLDAEHAEARREAWLEAGPHPVAVLDPEQTGRLVQRIAEEDGAEDEDG